MNPFIPSRIVFLANVSWTVPEASSWQTPHSSPGFSLSLFTGAAHCLPCHDYRATLSLNALSELALPEEVYKVHYLSTSPWMYLVQFPTPLHHISGCAQAPAGPLRPAVQGTQWECPRSKKWEVSSCLNFLFSSVTAQCWAGWQHTGSSQFCGQFYSFSFYCQGEGNSQKLWGSHPLPFLAAELLIHFHFIM